VHGFCTAADIEKLKSAAPSEPADLPSAGASRSVAAASGDEASLRVALDSLKDQVAQLQTALKEVQEEMRALRGSLGG
jgi:hypothetical protein